MPSFVALGLEPAEIGHRALQDPISNAFRVGRVRPLTLRVKCFRVSLLDNDRIRATRHIVKKAKGNIDRYTLALFLDPPSDTIIQSHSILTEDLRYQNNQSTAGFIQYQDWAAASYARYLVT